MTVWHGYRGVYFTGRMELREDGLYREVNYGGLTPVNVFVKASELSPMPVACVSAEPGEIAKYYAPSRWLEPKQPLTVARMLQEFKFYGRQFAFVYGDESCIPDRAQRLYALRDLAYLEDDTEEEEEDHDYR